MSLGYIYIVSPSLKLYSNKYLKVSQKQHSIETNFKL
jgi:hypothetical protein